MKKIICTLCLVMSVLCVMAQDSKVVNLQLETRMDYQREYLDGDAVKANSGFKGKYLNVILNGTINEHWSYSYRQRLNKAHADQSFFDATDWIHLTYRLNDNWSFNGGKQVVGIGGYEYDRAPKDLYFCSEFWNNIACYQFGVSSTFTLDSGKDTFLLQLCESPFRKNSLNVDRKEMFAYNLMWYGNHDWFSTMYSFNMIEYMPGRFINYIVLGNQFTFGNFRIDLDIMNRAASIENFFGKDMSVMGEFTWKACEHLNVIAKCTYDVNNSNESGDLCVAQGTDIVRIGAALEYFPIKTYKDLRLHLNCCYTDGRSPASAVLRPKQTIIDAGITWKVGLLDIRRKNRK